MSDPFDFIRPSNDELSSSDGRPGADLPLNARAEDEVRQFDEAGKEQKTAELRAEKELDDRLDSSKNKRELMRLYGKKSFIYLKGYSIYCGIVVLLQGFSPHISLGHFIRINGFKLDDTPLTVLVGSTEVSVIGLVAIMLRGIFDLKEDKKKTDSPTDEKNSKKT